MVYSNDVEIEICFTDLYGNFPRFPFYYSLLIDEPRTDAASITDYFVNFLKIQPQGVIIQGMVRYEKTTKHRLGFIFLFVN
jgi:hypothetical protein